MRTNNTLSKIMALVLSIAMVVTTMPIMAFAEGDLSGAGMSGEITAFAPLDTGVASQTVPLGTPIGALSLPDILAATVELPADEATATDGITPAGPVTMDVPVTWESTPDYDGNTAGAYVFNAVIGGDYTLAATLPAITVTVGEQPQAGVTRTPSSTPDYFLGDEDAESSGKYLWSRVDALVGVLSAGQTIQITSLPGTDKTIELGANDNITIIGMGSTTNIPNLSITTEAASVTLENISLTANSSRVYGVTFTSVGTHTLTVNGAVSVTGKGTMGFGIYSYGALEINGGGTLHATGGGGTAAGSAIYVSGSLTIGGTAEVIAKGGEGGTGAGGDGIFATGDITISSKTTATGGISDDGNGGNGIFSSGGDVIITAEAGEVKATGGNSGGNSGHGISAYGAVTISAKTNAKGGDATANNANGGDGISASGLITISAKTTATGGKGDKSGSNGGYGIYSNTGGVIINEAVGEVIATGGEGNQAGGYGIYADDDIEISAQTTATGGIGGTNGGNGIYSNNGAVTIDSTAVEVIATGGNSSIVGGNGIFADGDIEISAQTTAKGGNGGTHGGFGILTGSDVIIPAGVTVEAKGGNGATNGVDFAFSTTTGKIFVTENGATLIGSGRNFAGKIVLIGDASGITLNNINLTAQSGADAPGISFGSANPNTLTVIGTVTAEGSGEVGDGVSASYAGLEIKGSGTLIANGGIDGGIGDIGIYAKGDLIISAKTTATGGGGSAYSGHGIYCDGAVTINQAANEVKATGGTVTAGTSYASDGIYAKNGITISAKTTAAGGDHEGSGSAGHGISSGGAITINQSAGEVITTGGNSTGGNGGYGISVFGDIAISAQTTATGGNGDLSGGNGIFTLNGNIYVSGVVTATGGNSESDLPSSVVDGNAIVILDNNKSLTIEKAGEANAKLILADGINATKSDGIKTDPKLNLTMAAALVGKEKWVVTPASALIGGVSDANAAVLTTESPIEIYVGTPQTNNGGGSSGGGGGGVATTTPPPAGNINNQPLNVTVTTTDGTTTVSAAISSADAQKAIEAAAAAAENSGIAPNVVITIPAISGKIDAQTSVSATIPAEAMAAVANSENTSLTLNTPAVTLTFDSAAVQTIAGAADTGDVKINANIMDTATLTDEQQEQIGDRPVYEFTVTADGSPVTDFNGNVTVSIPYTPKAGENPNGIVVYYVGADGTLHCVENGVYDPQTGKVSFTTNHFSVYMIGYNLVTFSDIPETHWGKAAIEKSAARGLVSGVGGGKYSPDRAVTRAEFIQMVQNALKLPSAGSNAAGYADVTSDMWYFSAVMSAKSAGLLSGLTSEGNNFLANQPITREEMGVILANTAAYKKTATTAAFDLSVFSDFDAIESGYAQKLELAIGLGLLNKEGVGGGRFDPKGLTTRAQAAQILINLLNVL